MASRGLAAERAQRMASVPPPRPRYSLLATRYSLFLMLAPAVLVVGLFLVGGVGFALAQSLGWFAFLGENELTPRHYAALLTNPDFGEAVLLSLRLSAVSTAIALVISLGMAMLLRTRVRGDGPLRLLFQLPLPVPHLVAAVGITLLVSQSGVLARVLFASGLLRDRADFPLLVNDPFGVGILLVYIWKEVPFITLLLLAALAGIGEQLEWAASTLGASPWQRFRHVVLPLLLPAMLSSSLIVFAFTFGAFEVPYVMGRTYPKPVPVWAWERFSDVDLNQRPEAMAASVLITLFAALIAVAYAAVLRRSVRSDEQ